jgi:hypothetical protein
MRAFKSIVLWKLIPARPRGVDRFVLRQEQLEHRMFPDVASLSRRGHEAA